jgi:cytochrome P450
MFLSMMGLPPAHFDEFLHFKDLVLASSSEAVAKVPVEERERMRQEAVTWIQDYFAGEIRRRETSGEAGDDMLGWLLTSEVDGEKLPRENLLDILGVLMIAGLDTVGASLACSLSYLARHAEQRSILVADPSLWPSAIEELLRYESPVTSGGRVATTDLDLPSGEHIPAGTLMALSWHAANVDPGFFPDPLTVDFARSPNRHMAFASGFHRCLGSHLARMELTVALEAWHSRIPDYQIKPGTSLTYSEIVRTPRHLPLIWSVA